MVLIILFTQSACAIGITPYADSEFSIASASLSFRKTVSFSCITYVEKSCMSITKCWLQQKINHSWIKVCDLDAPINTATNSMSFGALMDYSSTIDTGTFRVGFTVNADDSTGARRALPDPIGQCPFFSIKKCSLKKASQNTRIRTWTVGYFCYAHHVPYRRR